jgi:hypothetical protein
MDFKEIECEGEDWTLMVGSCEHGNKPYVP